MRRAALTALLLISGLKGLASSRNEPTSLPSSAGTGTFLLLSDIHFDPYDNPAIMKQLGAEPKAQGCPPPNSGSFSKLGSDTNYPLLKSALENVVATASANHVHYDYVILAGDLLAHNFDLHYRQCVGGRPEDYEKFALKTIGLVDSMIAKAVPGLPVFAALGNNDTDKMDYMEPTGVFLSSVGREWSLAWGRLPAASRDGALATFNRAGYYVAPHPTIGSEEFIILNTDLWTTHNSQACSETDPDPGGQFQFLGEVLAGAARGRKTATIILHILPGVDAMKSMAGPSISLWTDDCTQRFISELSDFRGVVHQIFAGHIHRDDFRIFPDRDGKPLLPIHVIPSVSPVYFNNPAVEIGWYDKHTGNLADYAPVYLDLANSKDQWATEYLFTRAYGRPRPNLAALVELGREIHDGNPQSGIGKTYANYYGVGVGWFLTQENWSNYTCTQTEIIPSRYSQCKGAAGHQ